MYDDMSSSHLVNIWMEDPVDESNGWGLVRIRVWQLDMDLPNTALVRTCDDACSQHWANIHIEHCAAAYCLWVQRIARGTRLYYRPRAPRSNRSSCWVVQSVSPIQETAHRSNGSHSFMTSISRRLFGDAMAANNQREQVRKH
jgi:hypothetical protein